MTMGTAKRFNRSGVSAARELGCDSGVEVWRLGYVSQGGGRYLLISFRNNTPPEYGVCEGVPKGREWEIGR